MSVAGFLRTGLVALALVAAVAPAKAVNPDEVLSDPALEARARDLSAHLRCMVCQNQSIDDSDAALARDLRLVVRDRLTAGDTDAQIIDFVVARYGEFVLLKPRLHPRTIALWASPLLLLGIGGVFIFFRLRAKAQPAPASAPLDGIEQAALDRLLSERDRKS
jgi:cytochrome c-type biogenesis protein CcmH